MTLPLPVLLRQSALSLKASVGGASPWKPAGGVDASPEGSFSSDDDDDDDKVSTQRRTQPGSVPRTVYTTCHC